MALSSWNDDSAAAVAVSPLLSFLGRLDDLDRVLVVSITPPEVHTPPPEEDGGAALADPDKEDR